jgi:hypothetical protein
MVWKLRISKAVRQHFILFRSLDIAFVIFENGYVSPFIVPLHVYIEDKASWPENGTRAAFFFSILLPHSMSCYVYISTAQSLE